MGQFRTLTRRLKKVRDALDTTKRIKRGTFERSVVTLSKPMAAVERSFHFTKGPRERRVAT